MLPKVQKPKQSQTKKTMTINSIAGVIIYVVLVVGAGVWLDWQEKKLEAKKKAKGGK